MTADKAGEEHLGANCKARGASCDSTLEEKVLLGVYTNTPPSIIMWTQCADEISQSIKGALIMA